MAGFNIANGESGLSVRTKLNKKLGAIIDVKADFGAVGDGSADDTPYFQAAFNSAFGMAQFTGVISGNMLDASSVVDTIALGQILSYNSGAAHAPVTIIGFGSGSGGAGTYTLSASVGPIASQPMMSCAGQGNYVRKKVFIPSGTYNISHPLYILGVNGAHVYGAGSTCTQLYYVGNASEGNVLDNAGFAGNNTWTPIIAMDGVQYSKFDGFDVNTPAANSATNKFVGIMGYQSGSVGNTTSVLFENMNVSNFWTGAVGVQGAGNVENFIWTNVTFRSCGMNGMLLTGQNVINWQVYGGGAASCAWLSTFVLSSGAGTPGAAYNAGVGAIGCLYGLSCSSNKTDVYNQGQQMHIAGGSFEGPATFAGTLTRSGGTSTITTNNPHLMTGTPAIIIYGAIVRPGYNGRFIGTVTGPNTITYSVADPAGSDTGVLVSADAASIISNGTTTTVDAIAYRIQDSSYMLPFYVANSGFIVANGCLFNPSNANAGSVGYISWLNGGSLELNGSIFQSCNTSSFKSAPNSELYLHGSVWIPAPSAPFSLFAGGRVRDYDRIYETTVAGLPAASAIFKGLRGTVTDGDAGLAWGATVINSGPGATPYEVWCNSAAWTVTGK